MARTFRQPGKVLTWLNDTGNDVDAGDVVPMEDTVGVALVDIDDDEEGSVAIAGVHELPKETGHAWEQGGVLNYDAGDEYFTTQAAGTGDIEGGAIAAADAEAGDDTGYVLLLPGTGEEQ